MRESNEWDVNEAVNNGSITMQEFADHGSEIVDALEQQQFTMLLTRSSKVVAVIVPMTFSRLIERQLANDPELQASLEGATRTLRQGETRPATELFNEDLE